MSTGDPEAAANLRALRLLEEVLDIEQDLRSDWLDNNCSDEQERTRVNRLLAQDAAASQAFDPPTANQLGAFIESGGHSQRSIGCYRLDSVISSGGMGIVWKASQDHPSRSVALKLIRQGFSSDEAMRRFKFEAEVLGRLDHSGIARIFDAGVHVDGESDMVVETPWFAMELVEGASSITNYADANALDTKARVGLFLHVCDALHHAHQRGVIHRDVKPQNILINDRGEVKLIDFGASYTDMDLTSPLTSDGQLLGTLRYMSPEQLDGAREELSTASDVYSLGVVLYELCCGSIPFDMNAPSSSHALLQALKRGPITLPRKINPSLSREVEAVILKCLENEPQSRYASPKELSEDLQRFLDHEPVLAHRATLRYRARLYARRHAGVLIVTGIVLAVALTGMVNSLRLAKRADSHADLAQLAERRSHLRAAGSSLANEDLALARRVLDDVQPSQRGFLWWSFELQTDASHKVFHAPCIYRLPPVLAPDASSYLVATDHDMISAYDSESGGMLWKQGGRGLLRAGFGVAPPPGYGSSRDPQGVPWNNPRRTWKIEGLAFGPLGKKILVSSKKLVAFLDPNRGGVKSTPPITLNKLLKLTLVSEDGLVHAAQQKNTGFLEVRVHSRVGEGAKSSRIAKVRTFALDRAGNQLAIVNTDGHVIYLRDLRQPEPLRSVISTETNAIASRVAFDESGEHLAVGRKDGSVELWRSGERLWSQSVHTGSVSSLTFNTDEGLLASGSQKGTIAIQDLGNGQFAGLHRGHAAAVASIGFKGDGDGFVSTSSDQTLRHWHVQQKGLQVIHAYGTHIGPLRPAAGGGLYAVTFNAKRGSLAQARTHLEYVKPGEVRASLKIPLGAGRTKDLLISERHQRAYVLTEGGTLIGMDLAIESNKHRLTGKVRTAQYPAWALTAQEERLIVALFQGGLAAFSLPEDEYLGRWGEFQGRAIALATSPDGRFLAVGSGAGTISLLSAESGKVLHEFQLHTSGVAALTFDPSGERLAIAYRGGNPTLILWSTRSRETIAELEGHADTITGFAFHPDENLIVSGSLDGQAMLWDLEDNAYIYSWNQAGWAKAPIWAKDGQWLARASELGQLRVLHSRPKDQRPLFAGFFRGAKDLSDVSHDQLALQAWKQGLHRVAAKSKYTEALRLAEYVRSREPNDPIALLAMALNHYRLGQFQSGLQALASLTELEKQGIWPMGDRPTGLLRALLLYSSGAKEAARAIYNPVIMIRGPIEGMDTLGGLRRPLFEEVQEVFRGEAGPTGGKKTRRKSR